MSRSQHGRKGWGRVHSLGPWLCPPPGPTLAMLFSPFASIYFQSLCQMLVACWDTRSFQSRLSEMPAEGELMQLG